MPRASAPGRTLPRPGPTLPLDNFARVRFARQLPLSTFQPSWKIRFAHLRKLLEEYRIDGVIWYQLAHDEIYDMEYTCLAKWLKELEMPFVKLETDFCHTQEKMAGRESALHEFLKSAKAHRRLGKYAPM